MKPTKQSTKDTFQLLPANLGWQSITKVGIGCYTNNSGAMRSANPALNPVRFALWTLRDKAAQRRLALR